MEFIWQMRTDWTHVLACARGFRCANDAGAVADAVVGGEEDVGVCEGRLLEDGLLGLDGLWWWWWWCC